MTDPRDSEPQPELTTSRVRGGPSPWLVAVIALAVLGTVVWIGVSGHDATTASSAPETPRPAVAAVESPEPTIGSAVPPDLPAVPAPAPTVNVVDQPSNLPMTYVAARLTIDGQSTLAVLNSQGPRQLHASYSVSLPAPSDGAQLQIIDVIKGAPGLATYGEWNVPVGVFHGGGDLDSIVGSFQPTVLVADHHSPDPTADPAASPLSINGYSIQVTGQQQNDAEIYDIDLTLGSGPTYPVETYKLVASAGGQRFVGHIQDSLPGHIRGEIFLPQSFKADDLALAIQVIAKGNHARPAPVGTYALKLPDVADFPNGLTTNDFDKAASNGEIGVPSIVAAGYQLHVLSTFDGPARAIFFDLKVNPTYPDEPGPPYTTATTIPAHWVTGDDGFVGWPTAAGG